MSLESSRPGESLVVSILKKKELKALKDKKKERYSKTSCLLALKSYQSLWLNEDTLSLLPHVPENLMLKRCLIVEDLVREFVEGGMVIDEEVMEFADGVKEELGWDKEEEERKEREQEERRLKKEEEERKRKEEEEFSDQGPLKSDEEWEYWEEDEEGNRIENDDDDVEES
ncbi:hypothetical protein TrVE_jg8825 [Triparma verrucosa]|uniref:Uncharacterized protein n=2 Tax=Triparma TaxID=722752 RepID=A0A9W7E7Y1_9STRA|nr:hypothetical protein TrST_g6800 [Triparma strigata]GMI15876.1 hypothetical protein TrVE_jg8825 [Triparma verrucosa]